METSTIVKSGDVNIQIKGFMKTSTQKRFCVLHSKTTDSHPFLEIYESKEAFNNLKTKQKKCDIKKIELNHVKSMRGSSNITSKGKECVIDIRCKHAKQILLFDNEKEYLDWNTKLNNVVDITGHDENSSSSMHGVEDDDDDGDEIVTLNQMYETSEEGKRFDVDVEPTALAKLCDCAGKRTLMVTTGQITFEDPATKRINYSFQLAWLRRFGKKDKMFTFEVGRKCLNGEGEINCKSANSKEIHELITQKSASKGSTVIPAARPPVSTLKAASNHGEAGNTRDASSTSNHKAINNDQSGITGPSLAILPKRHPGHAKLPTLIPITPVDHTQTIEGGDKKEGSRLRHSSKETDSEKESVDSARSTSLKHGPADENFAKELEHKFQAKQDSSKTKDKKRDDVKEKKENDKKEQEKEKKKDKEKKSWWKKDKDKDHEKDKGKDKSKDRESKDKPTRLPSSSFYEEPDLNFTTPPKTPVITPENLYDEATLTPSNNSSTPSEPVEYAQPFSRKGGVPISPETLVYADATDIRKNAWESYGRTENEEHHEEDYLRIKDARKENASNGGPPPIPLKQYEPDDDDTYNTLETNKPFKTAQTASQNIYGTASAKEVGQLPDKVLIPKADYDNSDSEGETYPDQEADGLYDDPLDDGYQAPADLKPSRASGKGDSYLSKPAPAPVISKKPAPPQESLYEDIS